MTRSIRTIAQHEYFATSPGEGSRTGSSLPEPTNPSADNIRGGGDVSLHGLQEHSAAPMDMDRRRQTILRLPGVKAETGYSRSTIYLRISQGLWTHPVSLGARSVGWPASEVAAINGARIAGKTDHEIRDLVARLEAARNRCSR